MKPLMFSLTGLVLSVMIWCIPHPHFKASPQNVKMKPDSLQYYIERMDLLADGVYSETMKKLKHADHRVAPLILRQFVERYEPQRMSFEQGVENENGTISLWWFMSEFALKADVSEFLASAETFFQEQDYVAAENAGENTKSYEKADGKLLYAVTLEDFSNYTGGPLCGGTVIFKITINTNLMAPTLGEILKAYPAVNSFVLPEKVEKSILKHTFAQVSYGGTWENYYSWNTQIICADQTEAEMLGKTVTSLLLDAGYVFHEEKDQTRSFMYKGDLGISFFHITVNDSNLLELSFQPNS